MRNWRWVPALPGHCLVMCEGGALMRQPRNDAGNASGALEFTILTAALTNAAIRANWSEFDPDIEIWVVPAGRMKSKRKYRVPLSDAAIAAPKAVKGCRMRHELPGHSRGSQTLAMPPS